jgi:hypothetical protein
LFAHSLSIPTKGRRRSELNIRFLRASVAMTALGLVALIGGLGWDA